MIKQLERNICSLLIIYLGMTILVTACAPPRTGTSVARQTNDAIDLTGTAWNTTHPISTQNTQNSLPASPTVISPSSTAPIEAPRQRTPTQERIVSPILTGTQQPSTSTFVPTGAPTTPQPPTATFDAQHIKRATQTTPALCPPENPNLILTQKIPEPGEVVYHQVPDSEQVILDILNAGGSHRALMRYLIQYEEPNPYSESSFLSLDITNDGVAELVVVDGNLRIFMCKDHRVYTAFEIEYVFDTWLRLISTQDMNLDGIPELLIAKDDEIPVDKPVLYQILGWDGSRFHFMIDPPDPSHECYRYNIYGDLCSEEGWIIPGGFAGFDRDRWSVIDIDHNGTREFIIADGWYHNYYPQYSFPARVRTTIFMWNGLNFSRFDHYLDPPKYRFQALQDGDIATLEGEYDQALDFYQQVIFDDQLGWWSDELSDNLFSRYDSDQMGLPTPTLLPPDDDEYYNMAAYARYRIMLVHIVRASNEAAQVVYDTLQEKFPSGATGYAYAKLASLFWDEYHTTGDIHQACSKASEYADQHEEEILFYISHRLGGGNLDYYVGRDICPF